MYWGLLVKERDNNIGIPLDISVLRFEENQIIWSWQTSLLWIVGELAQGGCVVVAVGVRDW